MNKLPEQKVGLWSLALAVMWSGALVGHSLQSLGAFLWLEGMLLHLLALWPNWWAWALQALVLALPVDWRSLGARLGIRQCSPPQSLPGRRSPLSTQET